MAPETLSQTTIQTRRTTTITKTLTELQESQKLFIHTVRQEGKQTTSRKNLLGRQCSEQIGSPARKTGKTESGPRKNQSKRLE